MNDHICPVKVCEYKVYNLYVIIPMFVVSFLFCLYEYPPLFQIGKGKKKRGSGSSCSSSVTSSRSATPSVRQAPTCIVISDDDSADSSKTKKKDPEFIPEQLVKRENAAGDGVAIIGESSGLIPKPPPVSG